MTIDEHYNMDGIPLERLNRDSVWNFHVWNEGWFRRPDLPPGNDGWQAFDATPQELSESKQACSEQIDRFRLLNLSYEHLFTAAFLKLCTFLHTYERLHHYHIW